MTDLDTAALDGIAARAERTSPSPWTVGSRVVYANTAVGDGIAECDYQADAAHIAGMDPATTLALVAEVRRLRAAVARVREPEPRRPQTAPTRGSVLAYLAEPDTTVEEAIDYALSYANAYEVPRWDQDRIVIEHGWLGGRCGRCGEDLPSVAALDGPAAAGGEQA